MLVFVICGEEQGPAEVISYMKFELQLYLGVETKYRPGITCIG
jgi:hypothetical protein